MADAAIKLIVGLGNPGPNYERTRHNAGAWLIEQLAKQHNEKLSLHKDLHGFVGKITVEGNRCYLLIPTTYMNLSGQAVAACAQYYKVQPDEILIAHDELDLTPGTIRLKWSGGHGGHNGLRDIFEKLGTPDFHRLRIGIGRTDKKSEQANYVLSRPPIEEQHKIDKSIERGLNILPYLTEGKIEQAMQILHTNLTNNNED